MSLARPMLRRCRTFTTSHQPLPHARFLEGALVVCVVMALVKAFQQGSSSGRHLGHSDESINRRATRPSATLPLDHRGLAHRRHAELDRRRLVANGEW